MSDFDEEYLETLDAAIGRLADLFKAIRDEQGDEIACDAVLTLAEAILDDLNEDIEIIDIDAGFVPVVH